MNLENMLKEIFIDDDINNYFYEVKFLKRKDEIEDVIEKEQYETIINLLAIRENYKSDKDAFESQLDQYDEVKLNELRKVDIEKIPLVVSSRICDVLWNKFHDITYGNKAVEKYLELFEKVYNPIHWTWCLKVIYRATVISAQIGKKNQLFKDCIDKIIEKLNLMNGKDEKFLSIELIEILELEGYNDKTKLFDFMDKIIENAKINNDIYKVEKAYELKLKIEKDQIKKKAIKLELGEYYENEADKKNLNDARNIFNKIQYLKSAIHNYNDASEKEKKKNAMKKLDEAQRNLNKCMIKIKSKTIDCTQMILDIKKDFEKLNFQEAVIRLVQYTKIYKKDEIRQKVLKKCDSISMSLFSTQIVDKEGKTLIELPVLDFNNPEKDEKAFELYMYREALEFQEMEGFILSIILNEIIDKYKFDKEDIRFLVNNNVIIPKGRENIILNGIFWGLTGDYYSALHILAPQMENLFRNIAKEVGGITFTLEDNNTSKVKVLSSVFEIEELNDCYNEDILFTFRSLLNEQAGANIRNDIGHGIMDEERGNSYLGAYFISVVIKLCFFTSIEGQEILNNSENLMNLIKKDIQ